MLQLAGSLFMLAAMFATCNGPAPAPVTRRAMGVYLGGSHVVQLQTLDAIPYLVRVKLITHLRHRLGPFFGRLQFAGGKTSQMDAGARRKPQAPARSSKRPEYLSLMSAVEVPRAGKPVPVYELYFTFRMPHAGIAAYTSRIALDADGNVVHEIGLPDFARHRAEVTFVPLDRIICTAKVHGFKARDPYGAFEAHDETHPTPLYDAHADAMAWRFSKRLAIPSTFQSYYKVLLIDAHTGKVLDISTAAITY